MKCQKCNFVSFDYLSECKKCGVDLTAVRDGLGLLDLKPSVPFYLESLLKASQSSTASQNLGLGIGPVSSRAGEATEPHTAPLDFEVLDDELTIELSDDELSHLIETPEMASELHEVEAVGRTSDEFDTEIQIGDELGFDLSDELADTTAAHKMDTTTAAVTKAVGDTTEDDLVLDLKEGDLGGLLLELEEEPTESKKPKEKK